MSELVDVSYSELGRAYDIMKNTLKDELKNPRTYLSKYLDSMPMPLMIHTIHHTQNPHSWDSWPSTTRWKLDALLGPHGHTIIKAWLARTEPSVEAS